MNHTPGPWKIKEHYDKSCIISSETGVVIAEVFTIYIDEKGEANSRLVASAPELLEALKRLVLAFDVGDMRHTAINGRGYTALDESRKAIAKAYDG